VQNNISRNGTAFVKNANPLGYYPLAPDQGGKPFAQATAGPQFRPNFFREGTGQMQPRDGGPSYPAYQDNGGFRGENQQFSRNVCPMPMYFVHDECGVSNGCCVIVLC